jgi:hypothetical protein
MIVKIVKWHHIMAYHFLQFPMGSNIIFSFYDYNPWWVQTQKLNIGSTKVFAT